LQKEGGSPRYHLCFVAPPAEGKRLRSLLRRGAVLAASASVGLQTAGSMASAFAMHWAASLAVWLMGVSVATSRNITQCSLGPCGPGNDICSGPPPPQYGFHLSDNSCSINDPNGGAHPCAVHLAADSLPAACPAGPFYDPLHKVYHAFYQRHLAMMPVRHQTARPVAPHGPVWGHWTSKDMVLWTQQPTALWNDQ